MVARLRERFCAPSWAFFEQVPGAMGHDMKRTLDAVAMGLWPSRGLDVHGIEVKVDRRDWLRELKMPAKAEAVARHVDYFWLAVSEEKIVQPGELPANWGMLVAHGKLLREVTAPQRLTAERGPMARPFVAAVLRRAHQLISESHGRGLREGQEKLEEGIARAAPDHLQAVNNHLKSEVKSLQDTIALFEKQSGLSLTAWDAGNVGKDVALMRTLRRSDPTWALQQLKKWGQGIADDVAKYEALVRTIHGTPKEEEPETA
jgi:hypothetical protein